MYVMQKDDMIFVYRNIDLFLEANGKNIQSQTALMMSSDYAIQVMDCNFGVVIKDRSAIFNIKHQLPIRRLLKLIEFMYEDWDQLK